jgi:hypothetical protein
MVANMLLAMHDNTRSAHITTSSNHDQVSGIKFSDADDLILGEVKPDGIVHLDTGVGITNRTSVVGDNIGHASVAESDLLYLEELIGRLLRRNPVDNKAALDIVQQAEVIIRLLNGEDIYWEISPLSVTSKINTVPMKPAGYVLSVRTLPSTLIRRCWTIEVTSRPVKAYFSLLRRKMERGRDSRSLWGPGEGRGAWKHVVPGGKMNQRGTHVCAAQFIKHP